MYQGRSKMRGYFEGWYYKFADKNQQNLAERGEIQVRADVSDVEKYIQHLEKLVNRTVIFILMTTVILALALVFAGSRLGI